LLSAFLKSFDIRNITKKNIPGFIGWIIMFVWLYSYFLPFGGFRFESNLYNEKIKFDSVIYAFVWLISCPIITFLFDGRQFVPKTFISVILSIISFSIIRITEEGVVSQALLFVSAACIGHIFASSCYIFFMVLNNTEKFYSMIFAIFIPKILMIFRPYLNQPEKKLDASTVIIAFLLLILAVSSFFYKNTVDEMPDKKDLKPPQKAYSLMPLVFVVLALNDVIAPTGLRLAEKITGISVEPYYFIGIVAGFVFIIVFQRMLRIELYNVINISFACISLGFVASILSLEYHVFGTISLILFGSSYILGMVNIYYLAGFMAKKFKSVIFYRVGILLSSGYYFSAYFFTRILKGLNSKTTVVLMAFISISVLILFFLMTPFFIRYLSSGEWMDDSYREDVTYDNRLVSRLKELNLSPREIETCQKLLEGYTLRQIAVLLKISFPTVNTYCNSIYRKLKINSRTELMVMLQEHINV